ncbi:MAG: hypothetical protein IT342_26090 [Candidatus Melainabacteria bacterium]|nr:hypothetical protein [Candidatus Melainabacteria bacterium]
MLQYLFSGTSLGRLCELLDEEIEIQINIESSLDAIPAFCSKCKRALCLRKQVMNLAVGNTDEMFCLECLGEQSDRKAVEVLLTLKGYALNRACFLKQWRGYESVADCPDPAGCFPDQCFSQM